MSTANALKMNKKEAIDELWQRGILSWKLDKSQKELYTLFHETSFKIQTWLLARRFGKTRTLCVLALEQCLRKSNSVIKFLSPTKLQVNNNIRPLMRSLLEDCPDELKPEFKEKDYIYYFKNGSEIQLAGTDNGHAEKLRGGDALICIVDEAQSCNGLDDIVKSILLPTTLTTKGKVLLAGTPPDDFEHDFLKFVEECDARGSLVRKTILDNPRLTPEMIEEIKEEMGGEESDKFKREMLCMIIKNQSTSVIPEFTDALKAEIIREWPKPPFYDTYEAMDLGFVDLTVILFAYYDFKNDKVIIEDEIEMSGQEISIPKIVKAIRDKEFSLWINPLTNEIKLPYIRVSDINHIVTNEIKLNSNNEIIFTSAKKDDSQAAINTLRAMLAAKKIIINPRCKVLIRHLENVKWMSEKNKKEFARSPDNGHYDAVMAAVYLVRHIAYTKNPYPAHYNMNMKDLFIANESEFNKRINKFNQNPIDVYKTIFGMKRK